MTTIREVAERAGVSTTTVSHVINNSRYVSEATRTRVLNAMNALNYRPNVLARSLRSGKTQTLGLILPDSSNPFFAEVGREVEATAFQQGYSVILCNSEGNQDKEDFYVNVLCNKQVDGIIFVATGYPLESLCFLQGRKIPVLVVDRNLPDFNVDAVLTDNLLGGYQATRHLLELGHRRIACISGPLNGTPNAERVVGYRKALSEYGIEADPDLVQVGDYHPESGWRATAQFLSSSFPPTAIFACNDLMAMGAIRALNTAGLLVPHHVAVVGFDNIELSKYCSPPLTTVAQPIEKIGSLAASILIDRIDQRHDEPQRVLLPTELIVRESSVRNHLASLQAQS